MNIDLIRARFVDLREMGFIESPVYDGLGEVMINKFNIKEGVITIDVLTKKGKDINCIIDQSEAQEWISAFLGKPSIPAKQKSPLKAVTTQQTKTEYNIKGVRNHLFEALKDLKNGTMSDSQAKSVASVAQVILNSAKLEMEYKKLYGKIADEIEMMEE